MKLVCCNPYHINNKVIVFFTNLRCVNIVKALNGEDILSKILTDSENNTPLTPPRATNIHSNLKLWKILNFQSENSHET